MKQRLITIALVIGCIAFGAVGVWLYTDKDKTEPEITVEEIALTYTEGESYDALLQGVTATDDVDGDLTGEVFVDKVVPMKDGTAIAYYGVLDESNNVGVAQRRVTYVPANGEAVGVPEEAIPVSEEVTETPVEEPVSEVPEAEVPLEPNGEKPALALTTNEMTIKAGDGFDKLSVVKDAVDNKDDKNELYRHIHADGDVNTNQPGTYEIRYYVTDSDGNASEVQVFTLGVE